ITNTPSACEFNPDWSIDGERVVYDRIENGSQELYTTDLASGATTPVPDAPAAANNATWSPNGQWLAFDRFFAGDPTIYLLPAAAHSARRSSSPPAARSSRANPPGHRTAR